MNLSSENLFILGSVKINPSQTDLDRLNDLIPLISDWDILLKTAIERGIGPLMYKNILLLEMQSLIPAEVKDNLQQAYYKTLRRSMVLLDAYSKIVQKFEKNGLVVIALKGIFLSDWLYGDIGLRQFSDIDLLIKPEDGLKGVSLLKEMGYASNETKYISDYIESKSHNVHFPPMILNMVSVELHTKLHRDTENYHVKQEDCWGNAIEVKINGIDSFGLQFNDLLIHLCVHLDKHFREGQLQFTCFIDIANLIDKYSSTLDWNGLIARCRFFNCEQVIMKYILLVQKYFYVDIPEAMKIKYNFLLTKEDEDLFYKYLQGYSFEKKVQTMIPAHIENLKRLDSVADYIKYFFQIVFPS